MKKAILVATCVAALSAFTAVGASAQTTGPAAQDTMKTNDMSKDGMKKDGMAKDGAMQNNNMGATTGTSAKPDASQQGAPTGAAVNSKGESTEPGKVKDGATR